MGLILSATSVVNTAEGVCVCVRVCVCRVSISNQLCEDTYQIRPGAPTIFLISPDMISFVRLLSMHTEVMHLVGASHSRPVLFDNVTL